MKNKLSACIILYNPTSELVKNIKSFLSYVDKLYLVDNSQSSNQGLIKDVKIEYIHFGSNKGIAFALNFACEIAKREGYIWMLTMDQDSEFFETNLSQFFNNIVADNLDKNVSIISPLHATQLDNESRKYAESLLEIKSCMTSGNLLNLEIWCQVGGFKSEFFIDSVDHEFCLRLRRRGFKIYLDPKCCLKHNLGSSSSGKIFGLFINSTHHNSLRRYYMTRNRLFVIYHYFIFDPIFMLIDIINLVKEFVKIVLIEKDKKRKLFAVYYGIRDFLTGKMGECVHYDKF